MGDGAVIFRAAVAEQPPRAAALEQRVEVIGLQQHGLRIARGALQQRAGLIRQERRAVEAQLRALAAVFGAGEHGLRADAVGRNDGHEIRRGVALHAALPVRHGVAFQDRLRADGRGIEQQLRPEQGHGPRRLREPLIPADADADAAEFPCDIHAGVSREKAVYRGPLKTPSGNHHHFNESQ